MIAPSRNPSVPTSDAIHFEHVSVRFGGVRALDDVSFSVGRGEVHCLAGENGSGKSTLIKVIAGVYQAAPGARTDYFGESVAAPTPQLARAKGVAVIWQDLALFPEMTVAENIAFDGLVGAPRLVNYRAMRATARAALAKLGVELNLSARLKSLPISGRQLVAIARALASDAKLVFMDEPTASLTQAETDHLLAVVRTLSASGVAVVFVSHRLGGGARRVEPRHGLARRTNGWRVRRGRHDTVAVDGTDDRQTVRPGRHRSRRWRCADRRRNLRPDAPRRVRECQSDRARRRDRRPDRLDRRRPHRTRPYAVRHDARRRWRDPLVRLIRRLHEQSRSHRRGHRLRLGGSSLAGPRAAAIDRRQHRDHDPEGDLRAPPV